VKRILAVPQGSCLQFRRERPHPGAGVSAARCFTLPHFRFSPIRLEIQGDSDPVGSRLPNRSSAQRRLTHESPLRTDQSRPLPWLGSATR